MSHDYLEVLIARALQAKDNSSVKGNTAVWRECYFLSVSEISECYLTSRYPPILLKIVGYRLETAMCWFVIQTDKLNSSVQVCLAGSLHDYVTLLQVYNSFLIFRMGFLILCQTYSFFFPFFKFFGEKKKHDKNTKTWNVHCHAYQIVCSVLFFLCVTSQYSKIYTVNDFQ